VSSINGTVMCVNYPCLWWFSTWVWRAMSHISSTYSNTVISHWQTLNENNWSQLLH